MYSKFNIICINKYTIKSNAIKCLKSTLLNTKRNFSFFKKTKIFYKKVLSESTVNPRIKTESMILQRHSSVTFFHYKNIQFCFIKTHFLCSQYFNMLLGKMY